MAVVGLAAFIYHPLVSGGRQGGNLRFPLLLLFFWLVTFARLRAPGVPGGPVGPNHRQHAAAGRAVPEQRIAGDPDSGRNLDRRRIGAVDSVSDPRALGRHLDVQNSPQAEPSRGSTGGAGSGDYVGLD